MENNRRGFTGLFIPVELLDDTRLDWTEIGILAEIDALAHSELGCIASDEHFAEMVHCSVAKVKKAIRHLKDLGYVERTGWDGRTRTLVAHIREQAEPEAPEEPKEEKPKRKKKEFTPPTEEEVKEYAEQEYTKRGEAPNIAREDAITMARKFCRYYSNPERNWHVGTGKKMSNWKKTCWDWIERENERKPGRKKVVPVVSETNRYSV